MFGLIVIACTMSYGQMRDPTKPEASMSSVNNGYTLTAIMISSDKKIAIINGQVTHIGDDVDGSKVINIGVNTVELDGPNGKMTLTLMIHPIVQEENSKAN